MMIQIPYHHDLSLSKLETKMIDRRKGWKTAVLEVSLDIRDLATLVRYLSEQGIPIPSKNSIIRSVVNIFLNTLEKHSTIPQFSSSEEAYQYLSRMGIEGVHKRGGIREYTKAIELEGVPLAASQPASQSAPQTGSQTAKQSVEGKKPTDLSELRDIKREDILQVLQRMPEHYPIPQPSDPAQLEKWESARLEYISKRQTFLQLLEKGE